ncbi:MAG: hypothetical protein R3E01_15095 [Pirellulaceae bacterium]
MSFHESQNVSDHRAATIDFPLQATQLRRSGASHCYPTVSLVNGGHKFGQIRILHVEAARIFLRYQNHPQHQVRDGCV